MAIRALFPIIGLLLVGCASGVATSDPPAPAESTGAPSAQVTPSQAEPTSSPTCEPGDDGTTQVVLATANIFAAGRDAPPQPGGGGGGTLPPVWELPSGSTVGTFPCATGEVTPFTGQSLRNGPAGDTQGAGGESTDVTSYEGISGIVNQGNGMFLVGVFLTDGVPSDPAPPRLDFTDVEDFEELAPEIFQTFFVGDGMGRTYRVPSGATRLYLGFADAFLYEGPPGWYGNNAGELEVTVAVEAD
jgi:hypothetical protein